MKLSFLLHGKFAAGYPPDCSSMLAFEGAPAGRASNSVRAFTFQDSSMEVPLVSGLTRELGELVKL
eukprot:1155761-Pelagomonas_calceolata.AAC.4